MAKKNKKQTAGNNPVVATNRRARHEYKILETYECGVVLVGTEVKSLREGKASLTDAFATIDDGEVWLRNLHIPEYSMGHWTNHSPKRTRKLLLHRREIDRLRSNVERDGYTLVPLAMRWDKGKVKVTLGLAKGKKSQDKRDTIKDRDWQRQKSRLLRRG